MSMDEARMVQSAPWPWDLEWLVDNCDYKPNWVIRLYTKERGQRCEGLTLEIDVTGPNSYPEGERTLTIAHQFAVPAAAYGRGSWQRWLFDRICDVERHEAMEHFRIEDQRPFAPMHSNGNDPYFVHQWANTEGQRTPGSRT